MRIKSLQLNRFGHFNDHIINLGEKQAKKPDFHIVYGANEAGKSTTLSAIIDLLFGMPLKTKFNFLHKNDILELSATLTQASGELSFKRFKNKLTDSSGNNISANAIDTHGLDRAEYIHRFSFDEDMLKAGGESILQNQGELGATLFSATSGLTGFTKSMDSFLLDSETYYHPNTRKLDKLAELKEQLDAIKDEQKALDISANAWSKKQKEAIEKQEAYRTFANEAQARKSELTTLETTHTALDIAREIDKLEQNISKLAGTETLPLSWITNARTLLGERTALQKEIKLANEKYSTLQEEFDAININNTLINQAATIEHLNQSKLLFVQRNDDLNNCSLEIKNLEQQIEILCKALDVAEPISTDFLHIAKPTLAALEQSLKQIDHLQQQHDNAKCELDNAQLQVDPNNDATQSKLVDITPIDLFINESTEQGLQAKIEQTQHQLNELNRDQKSAIQALKPWLGSIEELANVSEPKQLNELHRKYLSLESSLIQCEKICVNLETEKIELTNQLNSIESEQNQPSPTLALNKRSKAWDKHTNSINEQLDFTELQRTAREFSQAMQEHDLANLLSVKNNQTEEKIRLITQQIGALETKIELEKEQLHSTKQALNKISRTINKIKTTLMYSDDEPFDTLINWFKKREHALHVHSKLSQLENSLAQLHTSQDENNFRLKEHINALLAVSNNNTDTSFLHNASFSETAGFAKNLRDTLRKTNEKISQKLQFSQNLQTEIARRKNILEKAHIALNNAQNSLKILLQDTFLSNYSIELLPALQTSIVELQNTYQLRQSAKQKLAEISKQQEDFNTQLNDISARITTTLQLENNDPLSYISALADELSQHKTLASAKAQILNEQATIKRQLKQSYSNLDRINQEFKSKLLLDENDDAPSVQSKLDNAQLLAEKHLQLAELAQSFENLTGVEPNKDTLSELLAKDPHHVQGQIADLNLQIETDQTQLQELHFTYRSAQNPLDAFQSNNRVAQLAQLKASLLLEIEQLATAALEVRLGYMAIQNGLDKFRENNKSSMLQRANTAFQTITCGNFVNLVSQPNGKGGDQLIAINKEGMSKQANEMSTGTRTQLYLALRVAAYQDYCELRSPLPFVADDIMETFDDDRASATLGVLNGMANAGQVIYFTHHRHLLELAKNQIGPNVHIHELPARPKLTVVPK